MSQEGVTRICREVQVSVIKELRGPARSCKDLQGAQSLHILPSSFLNRGRTTWLLYHHLAVPLYPQHFLAGSENQPLDIFVFCFQIQISLSEHSAANAYRRIHI